MFQIFFISFKLSVFWGERVFQLTSSLPLVKNCQNFLFLFKAFYQIIILCFICNPWCVELIVIHKNLCYTLYIPAVHTSWYKPLKGKISPVNLGNCIKNNYFDSEVLMSLFNNCFTNILFFTEMCAALLKLLVLLIMTTSAVSLSVTTSSSPVSTIYSSVTPANGHNTTDLPAAERCSKIFIVSEPLHIPYIVCYCIGVVLGFLLIFFGTQLMIRLNPRSFAHIF